ncbi:MAG: DNA polymerase I [Candidatus Amulumruptor sp.]|nr:DNA polymerase I [Candidatus Amulumruptor sp.]
MDNKRLFLLDAYALIYRAYYAMIRSPRVTSAGVNTSAVMGFVNTLDELLRKERPTHIAVCFDPPHGKTFRHEEYPEYKAQREKQPEDITLSLPYIERILNAMRIPMIMRENYEADDVIGTLAQIAQREGYTTYMMTPDKDYAQLVTDHIFQYRPSLRGEGFEIRGPKEVCERFGVPSPERVIDLLALEGDASDNIPGCPGVGEKTAVKLLAEYDNVENIIGHADEIKGALGKKIRENVDNIRFSKYLATIKTDVPTLEGFDIDSLERRDPDVDELIAVYGELEFRTFIKRLTAGQTAVDTSKPTAKAAQPDDGMGSLFDLPEENTLPVQEALPDYDTASSPAEAAEACERARKAPRCGIAFVAPGPDAMTARWTALVLVPDDGGRPVAINIPAAGEGRAEMMVMIQPLLAEKEAHLVAHDFKRCIVIARREEITVRADFTDTAIAHYLLEPEMKHGIELLARKYLDRELPDALPDTLDAALLSATVALALEEPLLAEVEAAGLTPLMREIELPLERVLADMEFTGVRIDSVELGRLSAAYTRRLQDMEQKVYELAGTRFNLSSPMQVGEVLFDRLKIDVKAKRTKRGGYSTTEDILLKYAPDWPIVSLILDIRGLRKLLATYINALPALVNPVTGKIHTTYNQTVTATGRISSTNPNLQNIPVRTDDGREIRRAFISDPGDLFMSADYSQIELRLMADLSGDPDMVGAFRDGADIHRATAAKIYKVPLDEVTDDMRRNAKTANFGIIYGISAFGLAERLGIPRGEAKDLIEGYFSSYPHIADYIGNAIKQARTDGYVTTIMGRRRILADINSRNATVRAFAERNAVNAPIQGSAADIIKLAMVRIAARMEERGMRSRMIMQVHDELIFNVKPDELPDLQAIVMTEMAGAYRGKVKLEVAAGTATNWLEAH